MNADRKPRARPGAVVFGVAALVAAALPLPLCAQPARPTGPSASAAADREQGLVHLREGRPREALAAFRAAVAQDPADAVSQDAIGVILGDAGALDDALLAFQQAARLDPSLPEARFHLGLAYERKGLNREAIVEYEQALQRRPDFLEARYGLSTVVAKVGDLEGAIRLLRQVIAAAPDFAEARYNLGADLWNRYEGSTGLRQRSDLDEAVRELEMARRLDPRQAKVHFALGQILAERQSLVQAVESLERAVALAPESPDYAYNLGLAFRLQGNLEAAEAQLRAALQKNPRLATARRALGLLLRQTGQYAEAAVELRLAAAQLPDDPQSHHDLGTARLKLEDVPGAIESFRRALELDPRLTETRVSLAQALLRAGRKDEARQEQAEVQRQKAEQAAVGRAMILLETAAERLGKGERMEALERLREAVAVSPEFAEAHYQLGLALRSSGSDAAEAERAFRRVLDLDSHHPGARCQLGLLLLSRGDMEGPALELRRVVEAEPGMVEARRGLAHIALRSRDWLAAVAQLRSALAWEPDDADAHRDLATALEALGEVEEAARERAAAQRVEARRSPARF